MPRLPKPGSDQGKWGEILNDYLSQAHTDTGTLKPGVVTTSTLTDSAVTTPKLTDNSVTTTKLADNSVTNAKIAGVGQANGIATLDMNSKLSESQVPERLGEDELNASFVYRDPTTQQVHFDVVQGKNDGTHLAFTSRVVHPTTGLPVLEKLIAKPATDLSEGIIDWRHDSPFGDLLHFTGGPNMGVGAAMIAIGSDAAKAGSIGLFYNGKGGTDTGMVGVKLINNSTINEATTAYALEIVQNSSTSPTMHVQQANNTATAVRLQAAGAITPTNQALLEILAAGGTRAIIRSKTGEYYSLADVIAHDGGGFLNVASGLSIDSHMTKQLSDGFNIRAYSGSPGIYYPGRISRSSAGLKLDVAPNTSSGPSWTGPTW